MTLLDDIIDGSTDPTIAVTDLLRKVQIVATRVGAAELITWVKQELQGYDDADLPAYRVLQTNVQGFFTSPIRHIRQDLTPGTGFEEDFTVRFTTPLMEIEAFANGESDPQREWTVGQVKRYEASGLYSISHHDLFSAHNVISRQSLRALLDTVRSKAMEFALELQLQSPDAGSVGGPTVASDANMARVVYNVTNNITGHGTNIATGTDIQQKSEVKQGDVNSLRTHAETLGLSPDDAREFAAAVNDEQSVEGTRVQSILTRVGAGALDLGGRVSASVVAGGLLEAGKQFLGIS